jgi:hypothetical protein
MSFASDARESRRDALSMLETRIVMSSLIFYLVLCALSRFSHGPNHRSYGFGSRENNFVSRRFGYDPRPHRGDRTPRRHGFPAGGSFTHFEPRHLDGLHFPRHGSRPTGSKGEVQKTVKTSSGCMVKC